MDKHIAVLKDADKLLKNAKFADNEDMVEACEQIADGLSDAYELK